MAGLVVGGVTIPVTVPSIKRDRDDLTDRGRAFDGTYRASATGSPKRDWVFSTPPLLRSVADLYEAVLTTIGSQICSGDIIGGSANLLTFPEELDNAAWTKVGATITANNALAPNGTVTADKIKEDTSTGNHGVTQAITAAVGTYKFQAWLSAVERTKALLLMSDGAGGFAGRGFDLVAGTTFSSGFSIGSWTNLTYSLSIPIPAVSWYLATVIATRGAGTVTTPEILMWTTTDSYLGVLNSGIHAWQPKLTNESASITACTEVTDWSAIKTGDGYRVVLSGVVHEV